MRRLVPLALVATALLAACGQKGNLYLPGEPDVAVPPGAEGSPAASPASSPQAEPNADVPMASPIPGPPAAGATTAPAADPAPDRTRSSTPRGTRTN